MVKGAGSTVLPPLSVGANGLFVSARDLLAADKRNYAIRMGRDREIRLPSLEEILSSADTFP